MKILFCIPTLDHGAERQLSYLAVELTRMGHEVHVASYGGGPNLDRLKSARVTWHNLGDSNSGRLGAFCFKVKLVQSVAILFQLIKLIRHLRPDIVQTILAPMDFLGGAAALVTRTPWILKESSSGPLYAAIWKYNRDWRYKLRFAFGRMSSAIVCNSLGGYDYWSDARDRDALHVIPNPIPLEEIAEADANNLRAFSFGPNEKVVLCAGRIDLAKNVERVIEALARVADELPFVAVICGDGSRRRHAEQMVRELGLEHRFIFTGYVDYLWDLMKRADVLISLSRFDGCPNVVLEGIACGCPLILSDIPAHLEILDERTALFADPHNPDVAARALREILMDGKAAQIRALNARERVLNRHITTTARLYEQMYRSLLDTAHNEAQLISTEATYDSP